MSTLHIQGSSEISYQKPIDSNSYRMAQFLDQYLGSMSTWEDQDNAGDIEYYLRYNNYPPLSHIPPEYHQLLLPIVETVLEVCDYELEYNDVFDLLTMLSK